MSGARSAGAGDARSAHRLQSAQRASLAAFLALLDRLRGELWTRQPAEVVDRVLQATGLFKHWRRVPAAGSAAQGSAAVLPRRLLCWHSCSGVV